MYKLSDDHDGKATPAGDIVMFQGNMLQRCKELYCWFVWGDQVFDIREVFEYYGVDDIPNYWERIGSNQEDLINKMINLVGDEDFGQVLSACMLRLDKKLKIPDDWISKGN